MKTFGMSVKHCLFLFSILLLNLVVAIYFNDKVKFADLSTLVSGLQNASAMVFAISGIWIAYLYPKAVASLVSDKIDQSLEEKSNEEIARIKLIVGIVILSGLVMAFLIIISAIAPLLSSTETYSNNKSIFDCIGLYFLISLAQIQLFCLYGVIASCVSFIIGLQNQRTVNELSKKFGVTHNIRPHKKTEKD